MTRELLELIEDQPDDGAFSDAAAILIYQNKEEPMRLDSAKALHLLSNVDLATQFCQAVQDASSSLLEIRDMDVDEDVLSILQEHFEYVEQM